ncbi:serine hydroxymethyltransferase [Candidatus Curtissbacteria bacterium RIFCSPLOWO2_01_FULL_39_62]|uniref:Serine hydroxymethyltransferase n=2 Tax=Candidatus Curtissiibacteriota TaxID=1752717 RepID=A0A1F5G6H3_9BACT|nr:MAG: serine hydroxymethyltransferase [Candidatus Curtissbacteria bacterium RIFCSPHIGHO2_01_FULL_39_57]OGD87480.1 MAG: serine hydroxymethyltransferase [Candidatus Curtissbacteria bacterium RIFCSPHIGHO2_02_FULL_40_16b]OGD91108.1 MAG: serine hydroxymethyltransferase [Candidatus Curtissbacteria bacterium RIFCSPHIGHO2_12_FULL_38_37]OGD99546.1 MAG: serine hydroxymethyltransferase [Candidatus Curtissbacteria bacterium RIFCSPLOWO2_02_FULL_40_11]OGE02858.1 MAG: serine hydroxymethyltransferase [Candid
MTSLKKTDPETKSIIDSEIQRQSDVLQLIPSENYTSRAVLEALGSEFTNKYSEGYPKKRYYQGNKFVDDVEILAQVRAKKIFGVPHANVQPYSGSPANTAVYLALLEPLKNKIMGLSLAFGGHLTHGSPVSISGKYFKAVPYELGRDGKLDFNAIEKIAKRERPKIIVCGFTAYPRAFEFEKFGEIADSINAYLLADISHIAGLVATGAHESPVAYAHIVMTTTHKTLRGPRGAILMVTEKGFKKDPELAEKIDKAVFPGLQGGPHDNQTAAIAVALREAQGKPFKEYANQIVRNSKALASALIDFDFDLSGGGSDNHLILIDLQNLNLNGAPVAFALEVAGIVTNKNTVPFDPMPPFYPSGIRIGTPSVTTRGMKEAEMKKIAEWIKEVVDKIKDEKLPKKREDRAPFLKEFKAKYSKNKKLLAISKEVQQLTKQFPIP